MLRRLTIENIGVIDRLDIPFDDGFTVLTGETGAGKSIIVNCIALALGAKADGALVRSGAEQARIEAVFEQDGINSAIPTPLLNKLGIKNGDNTRTIRVTRTIDGNGRGDCTVNGRKVALKSLQEAGRCLAESHGQRQTLALMGQGEQRDILDCYGELEDEHESVAEAVRQLREVRSGIKRLRREEAKAAARREELQFDLAAFREIAPAPGEDIVLGRERSRLANAEQLGSLTGAARSLLIESARGENGVVDALAQISQNTRDAAALDADLRTTWEMAESLAEQAQELALSLGRYVESLETNPNRLDAVEERIVALDDLKRRRGGSLQDVIAWGENAEQELAGLDKVSGQIAEMAARESRLDGEVIERSKALSEARSAAAVRFARALESEIEALAMAGTRIDVDVRSALERTSGDSVDTLEICDEAGCDEVEILIAPNEGEPPRPLSKIASGGEMARVTLAIKTVLAHSDARSLVLDEIDVGVGGHVGGTIGSKLANLARRQQVICVTHLPQVAAHADHHLHVFKETRDGRTATKVENLVADDSRIGELTAMIGSDSVAGRRSMGELLDAARGCETVKEPGVTLRLLEAAG